MRLQRKRLLLAAALAVALVVPAILRATTFPSAGALDAPLQAERVLRNEPPTTCGAPATVLATDTGPFHFDRYRFRNDAVVAECATVTLDPQG